MVVMLSDAAAKGTEETKTDIRFLCEFVSNEGLVALKTLEGRGKDCGTACALKQLQTKGQMFSARELWYVLHDSMWIEDSRMDIDLNPIADIINKYPEADSGPRDAWAHTLLQADLLQSHMNHETMFINGARSAFRCGHQACQWGFAYWDRKRLEIIARDPLPTTEQMISAGNLRMPWKRLCLWADFRQDGPCRCVQCVNLLRQLQLGDHF